MTARLAFVVLLACLAAASAQASGPRPGDLCIQAIQAAEARHATPPGLLLTIAKVESGRSDGAGGIAPWPWTIDADGSGQFFASSALAADAVRRAQLDGARYIDVGCLQVDLAMHPTAFRTLAEAFDPATNADYAARFLRALHDGPAHGNWYVATGLYHSATPDRAADYRAAVIAVGAGLSPVWSGAPRGQARVWLALAGGGATRLNLNRQPARAHRHLSQCQIAAILGPVLRSRARC